MRTDDRLDPLSAVAPLFRVRPEFWAPSRFDESWPSPPVAPGPGFAPFHLVTKGACLLEMCDAPPVQLNVGDIALLPHGDRHGMRRLSRSRAPSAVGRALMTTEAAPPCGEAVAAEVEAISGRLAFEDPHANPARAALPALIVLRTAEDPGVASLHPLVFAIGREVEAGGPGSRAIGVLLASALLLMALRIHFRRSDAREGLLRLLGKPQTARAVIVMLNDPARRWRLDDLAEAASESRATLVRDFRRLAGITPLAFLTELRLMLARRALASSNRPLADIAEEAGYRSEAAFSRVFRKRFNTPPGRIRRNMAE